MSGVPIPESSRCAVPEGGKLAGMRMIVVLTPCRSSASQNASPRRSSVTVPPVRGTCQAPMRSVWPASSTVEVEKYGAMVFGSRWMKSKMPCVPASAPVMKSDQATGLCGGTELISGANEPSRSRRARAGSRPSSIRRRVSW